MTLDQTGGGVPQARVVLHSVDENSDRRRPATIRGISSFENVKPGQYSLTAGKEGFANGVVNGVELAARQDLRLDVKLAVASVQQVVEVSASAVAVNTENATLTRFQTQ